MERGGLLLIEMKKENKYTEEELAQAHIYPHGLTQDEKKLAEKEIWEIRKKRLQEMDSEKILIAQLMAGNTF